MSKKDVKDKLTKFAPVAYLDFKDGDSKGFVRFHTVENCEDVLKKWHDSDKESDVFVHKLSDEEEKEYWTKVNADRQERFNAKRPKQRGADKVVKKAETASSHILFD